MCRATIPLKQVNKVRRIGHSGNELKVHIVPQVQRRNIILYHTGILGTSPALLSSDKIYPPPEKRKDLCQSAADGPKRAI